MALTIAFDVYGTLVDVHAITRTIQEHTDFDAHAFSSMWREKQLEYTFRRTIMGNYTDFTVCTEQALEFTCNAFGCSLTATAVDDLLHHYKILPVFDDVRNGLESLLEAGHTLYAFSNGVSRDVRSLLDHNGIGSLFADVVSVDDIRRYKPDKACYEYFLSRTNTNPSCAVLVSSNAFDIIGANSANLRTVWLRRTDKIIFDPWDSPPEFEIRDLRQLSDLLVSS